jgi:hypothetical protein
VTTLFLVNIFSLRFILHCCFVVVSVVEFDTINSGQKSSFVTFTLLLSTVSLLLLIKWVMWMIIPFKLLRTMKIMISLWKICANMIQRSLYFGDSQCPFFQKQQLFQWYGKFSFGSISFVLVPDFFP